MLQTLQKKEEPPTATTQIHFIPGKQIQARAFAGNGLRKDVMGLRQHMKTARICARARVCREKRTFPHHSLCSVSALACFLACHNSNMIFRNKTK